MIVKKRFNPIQVIRYLQQELIITVVSSVTVYFLYTRTGIPFIGLPFSVAAILGSALAIFIAFRNNNSYSRWWEARTLWGNIINSSRIFARQIIANADHAVNIGKITSEKAAAYKQEIIYRQIAFAHALRLYLRDQSDSSTLDKLLSKAELASLSGSINIPNQLLLKQGVRIKEGMKDEILGPFDNISIEPTLAAFNNWQGACERIKNTPMLRQYHFFTGLFLQVFMIILPFSLINDFAKMGIAWLMVPVSVLISFVFAVMGKVGEVNEDPFENKITDVPLTALCNTIERDLKEMLGQTDIPVKMVPENGYLH